MSNNTSKDSSENENLTPAEISNGGKKFLIIAAVVVCLLVIVVWFFSQSSPTKTSEPNTDKVTSNTLTQINSHDQQPLNNSEVTDEEKLEKLVIAGPMASVSNPLIRLKNNNTLNDMADTIEFREWRDPNQMRAMVLQDDVDFVAMPTNAAANLYNKGVDLKLINVSVWGILYIISTDKQLSDLNQLKGKDLVMPFRGDMPDIVLQRLLQQRGIKPGEDIKLNYVANPIAAMRMLITGKADYAVLVEPAVSMALDKSSNLPGKLVAPNLYRSINLQEEWAKSFNTKPRMPQAGIAVVNPDLTKTQINRFMSEYSKALQWTNEHPKQASIDIVKDIPMLNEQAIEQSIQNTAMVAIPANEAKAELQAFFEQLAMLDSKLIGGKLPDEGFYYQP